MPRGSGNPVVTKCNPAECHVGVPAWRTVPAGAGPAARAVAAPAACLPSRLPDQLTSLHPGSITGTSRFLVRGIEKSHVKGGDTMAWLTILAAGVFETGFAVALKMSHGMARFWPTVVFAVCALLSLRC
jgi:hypothetical protein